MSKIRMNTNSKIIVAVIAAVLGSILLIGVIGNAFGMFAKPLDEMLKKERNELNYLDNWTLKSQDSGDGVKVTVNDDGTVKLNGKNNGGNPLVYTYEEIALEAGEYSVWGNAGGATKDTYHIVVKDEAGNVLAYADFDNNNTFKLDASTKVIVSIVVMGDSSVNGTFEPVLCKGVERVDFYA